MTCATAYNPVPASAPRNAATLRRLIGAVAACLLVAACASAPPEPYARPAPAAVAKPQTHQHTAAPRIVSANRRLECVTYARGLSGINLNGDAWTWWQAAAGHYARGASPRVGAVIVLKRKGRSLGHLAVITRIVNSREVIARHANWLNNGKIHLDTPIHDVSRANDWSAVKVWYTPGNVLGKSAYAVYGFIYPRPGQGKVSSR
ncbi:MAG: CHAP domain-containing protein [Proteobacteria bacterium]|nr:CHAP domain-containing protein [Pseudomonadota bacterium]